MNDAPHRLRATFNDVALLYDRVRPGYPAALFDVTSGSNGSCTTYLCKGAVGFDGPTGLGTPNGLGAFSN